MAPEEIKQILEQAFDGADVAADGDGSHFKVRLVSETFDGLRPVKKQQMVYQVLNDHIKSGAIHALSIETYTPQEWEKASKLLLKVEDIMHQGDAVPSVQQGVLLKDALLEITEKRLGMTAIVDQEGNLQGIFTDGDLRRSIERQVDFTNTLIDDVMTANCQTISPNMLAVEAVQIMEHKAINALLVTNDHQQVVGALNMHDLLKAGVV